MNKITIAPSILSADPLDFGSAVDMIENSGADWIHVDVMDGHFVPNLSFGLPFIKALKGRTSLPLDVHIMISNPDERAAAYLEAGADYLTFHVEAAKDPRNIIKLIREKGRRAGLALNPATHFQTIAPYCESVDLLLFMSVNPGYSGQEFMPVVFEKLEEFKAWSHGKELDHLFVAVDGGVSVKNIGKLTGRGANSFVSGSFFFKARDKRKIVDELRLAAVEESE
ncbi:MAG: ribulose-phosphate 3-epimerase [Deltaproteobacteria bacterium]|nr:ribulose-phosphate 3-epimerase [Deltaproteobacteria bacterium]